MSTSLISAESAPSLPFVSKTVTLQDGRSLGYVCYGHLSGPAIFFFHGMPGSRFQGEFLHATAQKLGARVISVDRPGMGLSTFQPNRKLLDWPADIAQLAGHLKLSQYSVLGVSGGGPYAMACAETLPRKELVGVGVVAGVGPWALGTKGLPLGKRIMLWLCWIAPWLGNMIYDWMVGNAASDPDPEVLRTKILELSPRLPEHDRVFLCDEEALRIFLKGVRESYVQGSKGNASELPLLLAPWGFELEDLSFEGVKLWYGTRDEYLNMGRMMATRLKGAVLKEFVGDSHITIVSNHIDEILKDMLESM